MREINSSVIDIYIAYVRSLQKIFSYSENQDSALTIVKESVSKLSDLINDFRIKKISMCLGNGIEYNKIISQVTVNFLKIAHKRRSTELYAMQET